MPTPVIVGATRTAIGRSFKGTLANTPPETLITTVLPRSFVGQDWIRLPSTTSFSPNHITAAAISPALRPRHAAWRTFPASR